jgi:GTP-sensing pleiotropic transcriptional regulator CodY
MPTANNNENERRLKEK